MRSGLHEQDQHAIILALKEQQSEETTQLLWKHYSQHRQFTPDLWKKRIVKNEQYWEEKKKFQKEKAAKTVQLWWKRKLVKLRAIQRTIQASTTIKRAWKQYERKKLGKEFIKCTKAALMIQKTWRGFYQHKRFKALLANCRYEDEDDFEYGGSNLFIDHNFNLLCRDG